MVAIQIRHEIFQEGVVAGAQQQLFARYWYWNNNNAIQDSKIYDQNQREEESINQVCFSGFGED